MRAALPWAALVAALGPVPPALAAPDPATAAQAEEAGGVQSVIERLDAPSDAPAEAAPAVAAEPEPELDACGRCADCVVDKIVVGPKESAWTVLQRAHVRAADIGPAVAAMRKYADLRSVYPGTELTLRRTEDGRLMSLERRPSPFISQCVERGEDGKLGGRVFELEVTTTIQLIQAELGPGRSIEVALGERGEQPVLAFQVRELLAAWDDATKPAANYDRMRLILEKRVLDGEVIGYGRLLALEYVHAGGKGHRAFWYEPQPGQGGYYDPQGQLLATASLEYPLTEPKVTSGFGVRKTPFSRRSKRGQIHLGLDFHARRGVPVYAARDGIVEAAHREGGYGNCVTLVHENGLETRYAHLSRFRKGLRGGVEVKRGELIGYAGNTGLSTGPHLHFETVVAGVKVDPLRLLGTPAVPLSDADREAFALTITGYFDDELPSELAQN